MLQFETLFRKHGLDYYAQTGCCNAASGRHSVAATVPDTKSAVARPQVVDKPAAVTSLAALSFVAD